MEPGAINSFLDQFLALADTGFGLIQGDVHFVLNALIVISIVLAGVQWSLLGEAPMAPFFRKVLFIGLFAFLINNWQGLVAAINQSGAMLGLRAGGSTLGLADLSNPGRIASIGGNLFGRTVALGEGMNILTDFIPLVTIFVAALCVMLGFFLLALQLFVSLISFKLGSLAAFVALPWGVFNGTAWVAERPLGWVAGCAIRLFILAFIASIAIAFVDALPAELTLDAGGALNVLLFGLTILALSWFGPQLASEVVQGQPHLAGSDVYRAGTGALVTTAAIGAGTTFAAVSGARLMGRAVSRRRNSRRGSGGSSWGKGGSAPGSGGGPAGGPPNGPSGGRGGVNYAGMQPKPGGSAQAPKNQSPPDKGSTKKGSKS